MKLKVFSVSAVLFLTFSVSGVIFANFFNKKTFEAKAYDSGLLPLNGDDIDLNDSSAEEIRTYYSTLLPLSTDERSGTNLLKNLKPILKNEQIYYSYENGTNIWRIYEIADRDWEKSPASEISGYNPQTNKITGYIYGSSKSSPGSNPFIHALYVNRDVDNQVRAWVNPNSSDTSHGGNSFWNIDREHIWPKSAGFENSGAGGARGDVMHLWPGDSFVNSDTHSNYFYGYVDTSKSYTNSKTKYAYTDGNLRGYSLTLGGNTTVFEPQDCDKGDIARAVFYMAARYNYLSGSDSDGINTNNPNLELVNSLSSYSSSGYMSSTSTTGKLGILQDLLEWNRLDPPDEFEIHRNNLLYKNYTNNRNPFIDFPEWAEYIWGKSINGMYNSASTGYADPTNNLINDFYNDDGSVTISQESVSIEVGETVTLTAQASDGSAISWSSSNSSIITVSDGVVTGIAAGNATITASATINEKTFSKTCNITVTEPIISNTRDAKLYSGTIEEGDYVIYFDGKAINTTIANNRIQYESVSPINDKISDPAKSIKWHISPNGDYWSIYNASASKYLASNGTKNQIQLIDDKNDDKAKWSISGESTYEFINKYNLDNDIKSGDGVSIAAYLRNNNTYGFACYSQSIGNSLSLYRIRDLSSISISGETTSFATGDEFTFGGTVTATYSDSSTKNVTGSASFSGYDMSKAGTQTVTVSYTEDDVTKTTTYQITLTDPVPVVTLSSIAITTYPSKVDYTVGETFSSEGLVITATYSDATTKDITSSVTLTGYDTSIAGTQVVEISYTEDGITKTTDYEITVNELTPIVTLESIAITTKPDKLTYKIGEDLDLTGMVVTATYSDKTTAPITDYTVSGYDKNKADTQTITITYQEKTATFTVTVSKELSSISITDQTSTFEKGDTFSFGGTVTATYSDGTSNDVTSSTTFSGYDMSKAGTQTVTVSYTEDGVTKTTTYEITVNEPTPVVTLTSITVTTMPTKVEYELGEKLDPKGLVVTATYSDGSASVITDYTLSTLDSSKVGEDTITVTYQGLTTTFKVLVVNSLVSISISNPTTTFEKGDEFSFGGTVTATYKDGTIEDVTEYASFSGYDMSKAGTQTVTVSYINDIVEKTATYEITINEPTPVVTLTGITITTNPTKLEYVTGEDLDLIGMVVTATYSDQSTSAVTDYIVSGYDKNKVGTQTITVTYQGYTATFSVTVIDGLKEQKDAAIKSLNEYYNSIDLSKYSLDNLMKLLSGLRSGESTIRAATTIEEINVALANAKAYLASIPQEEVPVKPDAPTNTCGGDIFATSAILSIIALFGAALIAYKKHK